MKKRVYMLTAAVCISVMLAACGQKEEAEPQSTVQETAAEDGAAEDAAGEDAAAENAAAAADAPAESIPDTAAGITPDGAQSQAEEGGYEDNFAVDSAAAAEFAGKIKAAVAEKNLEALADLASYPLYVGFADGSVSAGSRDELTALGAERIFTQEMMDSIAGADESSLSPSMAGFSLTKNGKPNIIFGVTDGKLTVKGMNY